MMRERTHSAHGLLIALGCAGGSLAGCEVPEAWVVVSVDVDESLGSVQVHQLSLMGEIPEMNVPDEPTDASWDFSSGPQTFSLSTEEYDNSLRVVDAIALDRSITQVAEGSFQIPWDEDPHTGTDLCLYPVNQGPGNCPRLGASGSGCQFNPTVELETVVLGSGGCAEQGVVIEVDCVSCSDPAAVVRITGLFDLNDKGFSDTFDIPFPSGTSFPTSFALGFDFRYTGNAVVDIEARNDTNRVLGAGGTTWVFGNHGDGDNPTIPIDLFTPTPQSITTDPLFDVFFIDSSDGWAIGPQAGVWRTTDGGQNWAPATTSTPDVFCVTFANAFDGWISGGTSTHRSTDAGDTWNAVRGLPERFQKKSGDPCDRVSTPTPCHQTVTAPGRLPERRTWM